MSRHVLGAVLACLAWWGLALHATRSVEPLPPDAAHNAVVARNLARGRGNTIDWVPFHFGLREKIRAPPEWHGLLQPAVLAALFATFGVHDELICIPGLTFTAATGLVAFLFAAVVFGVGAGWLACLLTLSSAGLFRFGWVGTDDTGFAFFFLLTLFFAYLGLERDGKYIPWAGLAGALALLEKQTGLYLAGVFLAVLWLGRGRGASGRWAAWLFVPFLAAFGLYLLRNHAAYGGFQFRLGALNWLYKADGFAAIFAFYPTPPRLADVLADLGPARVVSIVGEQFQRLGGAVFTPSWRWHGGLNLLAVGVPSLLLHVQTHPMFTRLTSLAIAGGVLFVCGLYSVEPRYFLMFVPLAAISLGGAIARGLRAAPTGQGRVIRPACVVVSTGIVAYAAFFNPETLVRRSGAFDYRGQCRRALAWIREHVPEGEVVLSDAPGRVSWVTERLGVKTPRGSRRVIERVIEHYGVRWVFVESDRRPGGLRALLSSRSPRLVVDPVFTKGSCRVYAVRPDPTEARKRRIHRGASATQSR